MKHFVIKLIPSVIPDYQYVNLDSPIYFLFGESANAVIPQWKEYYEGWKKQNYNPYLVGHAIVVYVLNPDGTHEYMDGESEVFQIFNKIVEPDVVEK